MLKNAMATRQDNRVIVVGAVQVGTRSDGAQYAAPAEHSGRP